MHIKELFEHMELEMTGSDLAEKKLFSCTVAAVFEAYKGINKVTIETGFPCIPTI